MSRPLRWSVVRPGRMTRSVPHTRLPEIHVEAPNAKPPSELVLSNQPAPATDDLWDLPNTFVMARVDTRETTVPQPPWIQGDGFTEFPTASRFVERNVVIVVSALVRRFAARYAAAGKPMKYALLVVGPDSMNPALQPNAVVISRSPDDDFLFNPDGSPTGGTILFRTNGAQQGKAYFEGTSSNPGVFPRLKTALEAAGLPLPVMGINNIEARGDIIGSFPYIYTPPGPVGQPVGKQPGEGFFESEILSTGGTANPGLNKPLTATQTLGQWLNTRGVNQDGTPFNQYAPTLDMSPSSAQDPVNRFATENLASSAVTANFTDALNTAIFQSFKAVFGAAVPCGEWDIYCNTQDHQAPFFPLTRRHTFGSSLPIDRQIIKNYSDLPFQQEFMRSLVSQNLDWQTAWNWLQVYQPAGFNGWPPPQPPDGNPYPTDPPPDLASEPMQRVVLESQTRFARACANAAPHIPLMPSISIGFRQLLSEPVGTQQARRKVAIPYTVRYMLNCCALGAREFYLFASEWNTGQPATPQSQGNLAAVTGELIRTSNFELINAFNKRFKARLPMRNRTWRFSA